MAVLFEFKPLDFGLFQEVAEVLHTQSSTIAAAVITTIVFISAVLRAVGGYRPTACRFGFCNLSVAIGFTLMSLRLVWNNVILLTIGTALTGFGHILIATVEAVRFGKRVKRIVKSRQQASSLGRMLTRVRGTTEHVASSIRNRNGSSCEEFQPSDDRAE